jgi:8-oxo-dGTP pyrophosphatase MutT (NUDIX family)
VPDYIRWLRGQIGQKAIQLNFAAACICDQSSVLLQRRGDNKSWGFPGGGVELGESIEEAARREVREETGLEVSVNSLLGVYSKYEQVYPNGDLAQPITVFFRCTPVSGQLREDGIETLELKYFPLDATPQLFNQQHQDTLSDLLAGLNGVFR